MGKSFYLEVVKDFFPSTSEFSIKLGFHVKILRTVDFNIMEHRYVLTDYFSSDLMETDSVCCQMKSKKCVFSGLHLLNVGLLAKLNWSLIFQMLDVCKYYTLLELCVHALYALFQYLNYLAFYKEAGFSVFQIWFMSKLIYTFLHAFLPKLLHPSLLILEKQVIRVSFRKV